MKFFKDWGAIIAAFIAICAGIYKFSQFESALNQLNPEAISKEKIKIQEAIKKGEERIDELVTIGESNIIRLKVKNEEASFVRSLSIFTYNQPSDYIRGQEHDLFYFHIRTPDTKHNSEMYRYDLQGYAYGATVPLDITWVGYLFTGATSPDFIVNGRSLSYSLNGSKDFATHQYIGTDDHLYLKFGPINRYFLNFTLDYQSGRTGERLVHKSEDYSVMIRKDTGNY